MKRENIKQVIKLLIIKAKDKITNNKNKKYIFYN